MAIITLLERLEDDLPIGRIWVDELQGFPVPRANIGGLICDIETKPTLLEAGLASCQPLNPEMGFAWPMQALVMHRHSDGLTSEEILECVSADHRLVMAVRKFLSLAIVGKAQIGMDLAE